MSDSDSDSAAAMAAAMGFSGFGAQRPSKKRRCNPNADSAVASALDEAVAEPAFTGANNAPLGVRKSALDETKVSSVRVDGDVRGVVPGSGGNGDEIALDDDEDEVEEGGRINEAGSARSGYAGLTTGLAPSQEAQQHQSSQSHQHQSRPPSSTITSSTATLNLSHLPAKPPHSEALSSTTAAANPVSFSHHRPTADLHSRHHNKGNHEWWHDYHDQRFSQNPWDELEQKLGLPSQGTWLAPQTAGRPDR